MATTRERSLAAPQAGPPLLLVGLAHVLLFIASLVANSVMAPGAGFASPFGPAEAAREGFRSHGDAVRVTAFLQFASAIPLGIFAAALTSRLRHLGVQAAGVSIASFGGGAAALLLAISALASWTLSDATVANAVGAVRATHLFVFATGGPALAAALGLLYAGASVPSGFHRLMPRWLVWLGVALAVAGELAVLTLIIQPAALFIPLTRFLGFVWMIGAGAVLPRSLPGENPTA